MIFLTLDFHPKKSSKLVILEILLSQAAELLRVNLSLKSLEAAFPNMALGLPETDTGKMSVGSFSQEYPPKIKEKLS